VNVFLHAAGDDVARGELLLLRFVVRHEPFPSTSRNSPPSPRHPSVTRMPAGNMAVG
jgi:hypothetical protein